MKREHPRSVDAIHEAVALLLELLIFGLQLLSPTIFHQSKKSWVHLHYMLFVVVMRDSWNLETKCYDIHWNFCHLISLTRTLIFAKLFLWDKGLQFQHLTISCINWFVSVPLYFSHQVQNTAGTVSHVTLCWTRNRIPWFKHTQNQNQNWVQWTWLFKQYILQ